MGLCTYVHGRVMDYLCGPGNQGDASACFAQRSQPGAAVSSQLGWWELGKPWVLQENHWKQPKDAGKTWVSCRLSLRSNQFAVVFSMEKHVVSNQGNGRSLGYVIWRWHFLFWTPEDFFVNEEQHFLGASHMKEYTGWEFPISSTNLMTIGEKPGVRTTIEGFGPVPLPWKI